jgi:hypothetical protein
MADVSKLKRRLPAPPPAEEGAPGIERQLDLASATAELPATPSPAAKRPVLDGRSLRATGRVHQLNVKVSAETKTTILRLAKVRDLLVAEVIEQAIEALERPGDR